MKARFRRYGRVAAISLFLLMVCVIGSLASAAPGALVAADEEYVRGLVESANAAHLYDDKYWHTLVHYKKSGFSTRSLIDDPKFFLAEDGKKNPKSEMEATIRALFQEDDDETKLAVCRFVARYAWLKEKLHIDESRLPRATCGRFDDLMEKIRPKTAVLIFPTSHINSPASMFGHTLVTIETENGSKLLSHAINYSAVTTETFGPIFAVKGIFGLYKGYFSLLPYYAKVQEYSDFSQRDIWEYTLNLSEEEVFRMMMHIAELDNIYSDYYFFDENCSYNLLFLLDVARPSLCLTDEFLSKLDFWVIPIDTIRSVKNSDLVQSAAYRPSKTTTIRHIASLLPERSQKLALSIVRGKLPPEAVLSMDIPQEEKIRICDLVSDYAKYRYSKEHMTKEQYVPLFLSTLRVRSGLGNPEASGYNISAPVPPDAGHLSNRVALGAGMEDGCAFAEIRYRPAYHTLIDHDDGYIEGGQIVFTNVNIRYYPEEQRIALQNFDIIDIVSFSPRDRFFSPISWKIMTGFERKYAKSGNDILIYKINPGGGLAYASDFTGLFYIMMETELDAGKWLDDTYAAGVGASTGIIKNITRFWKAHVFARNVYYVFGDGRNELILTAAQGFRLTTNNSIILEAGRTYIFDSHFRKGYHRDSVILSVTHFF